MKNLINMIRKWVPLALIVGVLVGVVACRDEFLDVPATGQLTEDQIITLSGLEGELIGVYAVLDGRGENWHGGATNWLWGSIRGGDANKGTNAGDFSSMNPIERYEVNPTNTEVNQKWSDSYEGVARANTVLFHLGLLEGVPEETKNRIAAEARFLRGHFYFELKKNFNMVPWIDETTNFPSGEVDKEVEAKNNIKNDTDIWPNIVADFKFAFENLPETQEQVGRANKWAAASYLAKTYMYQKNFTEAKPLFDNIIANGVTTDGQKYGLFPDFEELFTVANENSQESIFAFQATGSAQNVSNALHEYAMAMPYNTAAGQEAPSDCCGFFQPSFDLAASYRTTAAGLPLLDGSYRVGANELKTDQGIKSNQPFEPDQGPLDPRLDHTIGRRGLPFLDWNVHPGDGWIRDQTYAGPYTPMKYNIRKSEYSTRDASGWTPGYAATNFMVIRFADVLLMAAEAEVEVGSLEKAREYVNMVRARAAAPATFTVARDPQDQSKELFDANGNPVPAANYVISTYDEPWTDQAMARNAVRFERKLELAMEGYRFYDLIRWEIADEFLNAYLTYEAAKIPSHFSGASFTPGQDDYLPIPQVQIDLQPSGVLQQNP